MYKNAEKYFLIAVLYVLSFCHEAISQTVSWQMAPRSYDAITRIGKDLFKVEKDGKCGLIKSDGSMVLDLKADKIGSAFSDHALVTTRENGKDLIIGALSVYGDYNGFTKKYYTIASQEFYSDGLITVADEKGRLGYIDDQGNPVLGFDGRFDNIKPFTEGYAAVFKNDVYSLVNKRGIEAEMIIGLGEVYGGTNVCNGIAYIWDTEGVVYTYDVRTGKCNKAKEPSNNHPDYLYCYQGASGRGSVPPYRDFQYVGTKVIEPFAKDDGMYGYSDAGFLLPAQFASATPFVDGLAIVKKNGLVGILKYDENGKRFSLTVPDDPVRYHKGGNAACWFALRSPEGVDADAVKVTVRDSLCFDIPIKNEGNGRYSFKVSPKDGLCNYIVGVEADGLNLWEGKACYTFKKQAEHLSARINVAGNKADANDRIEVTATISNPNDEPVTAEVRITGSNCLIAKTSTITVPAHAASRVSTIFVVKDKAVGQFANVSTSKGGSASTDHLVLEPFY